MPIWDQFDDFDLNVHRVPNPHRSPEVQRLIRIPGDGLGLRIPGSLSSG